jgi:menaquinone-9 beta-reductase
VFIAVPPARFRDEIRHDISAGYSRALADISASLGADVASARFEGALSVFAGRRGYLREAWGPGWVLVGDAGYFKDPSRKRAGGTAINTHALRRSSG